MPEVTVKGIVNNIVGNQLYFKIRSAANIRAETGQATLVRKNGSSMEFKEIEIGDKVEVRGSIWPDNTMNAKFVKNMSLYPHNGTFRGKIIEVKQQELGFIIYNKQGARTILTNKYTEFKKNQAPSVFMELSYGMTVVVKGTWERPKDAVVAKLVETKQRLLKISFTGEIKMISPVALTVVGENQVIYAVDISKAKLLKKRNSPSFLGEFLLGQKVRVEGKHVSEDQKVFASEVKNLSA